MDGASNKARPHGRPTIMASRTRTRAAAPETEAPEVEAPEVETPETEAPETEASETDAPAEKAKRKHVDYSKVLGAFDADSFEDDEPIEGRARGKAEDIPDEHPIMAAYLNSYETGKAKRVTIRPPLTAHAVGLTLRRCANQKGLGLSFQRIDANGAPVKDDRELDSAVVAIKFQGKKRTKRPRKTTAA